MRRFIFFLAALLIIGCQNTTNENKSEAASESEEQEVEVIGFDDPLVIDLNESMENLCWGNVRREFERVNNRYIEFDARVSSIYLNHFVFYIVRPNSRNDYYFVAKADKDVLVSIDTGKKYKFRGVFTFTELHQSFCQDDYIQINDVVIVEELIDSK